MHSKRSLIRMFTRILYAGGFILLVAGLLLSAVSSPALAAGSGNILGSSKQAGTLVPDCGCTPSPVVSGATSTPVPGGASSLVFSSGCNCSCQAASATVCNVGSGNMKTSVKWLLFYSVDGNPAVGGSQVEGGTLGPLTAGQCVNLNYQPKAAGNFAYYLEQEAGAAGPAYIWSNSCVVSGSCFAPTATNTPFAPATGTPTSGPPTFTFTPPPVNVTVSPTSTHTPPPPATNTATRPPLPYNLSAVCGYIGEQSMLWKVANHTNVAVDYTWRADNGETGSGSVGANGDNYFATSQSVQQVELFVGGEQVDTEQSVAPCKQMVEIAYSCTATGLEWTVRNPNNFGVDFTWTLDSGQSGHGTLGPGASSMVATSTKGAHRLDVTWTDTRPGTHAVSMSSPENSCSSTITETPTTPPTTTYTFTPAPGVVTVTSVPPTDTATLPPTETLTPPAAIPTVTPSNTATTPGYPPPVIITVSPTNTFTPTNTNTPVPSATNTATNTATTAPTAPPLIITVIVTNTPVPPTNTFTPTVTNTLVPQSSFVTVTAGPTNTNTPVPSPTNTATTAPPVIITVVITNTPAPTSTNTTAPTGTRTALPGIVPNTGYPYPAPATSVPTAGPTSTATTLVTLAPPLAQATQTPILIPVTGVDLTRPVGANGLSILGSLMTNLGLFTLGLALALTGYTRFTKR